MNQSNKEKLRIWISKVKKEVHFSKCSEKNFECMEFKRYDELMEFVRTCIDCGYKVG